MLSSNPPGQEKCTTHVDDQLSHGRKGINDDEWRSSVKRKAITVALAVAAAALMVATSGCAEQGSGADGESGGPIKMGLDTALTGPIGELGVQNKQGIQMYLDELNSNGGVLDRQVKLISRDDAADPATATTNTRNLLNDDGVVGFFGPVSSATAVAQSTLATQLEVPVVNTIANDMALSTTSFSPYVFQFVPNSHMEAVAVAEYVKTANAGKTGLRIATIAPDYNQGRTTVKEFGEKVKESGVGEVVNSQFPALGTTDFSTEISALVAAKPDVVFAVVSGADLITWTKQAESYGLFKNAQVIAPYGWNLLGVMKDQIPSGVATYARAPFFAIDNPDVKAFAKSYHEKYKEWPTDWSLLGYSGAQMWAQAVKKAGSTDAKAVRDALESVNGKTLLGDITFRACDHQAALPEYVGALSDDLDPTYGFKVMTKPTIVSAKNTMLSCKQAEAGR